MAARIADVHVTTLTRSGLDWMAKYPSIVAAMKKLKTVGPISMASFVGEARWDSVVRVDSGRGQTRQGLLCKKAKLVAGYAQTPVSRFARSSLDYLNFPSHQLLSQESRKVSEQCCAF